MPYAFATGEGSVLAELPVFDYLAGAPFYAGRHTPERVAKAWREEFDAQYAAGGYVNLTLHSRGDIGSARAIRAQVVSEFLEFIAGRPGVALLRCHELAARQIERGDAEPVPDWPLA